MWMRADLFCYVVVFSVLFSCVAYHTEKEEVSSVICDCVDMIMSGGVGTNASRSRVNK